MVYVHESQLSERLARHWANEIAENDTEGFDIATFKIRQVETGIVYDDAVDVIPCRYTYEATDEPIESEEDATEQDYVDALHEFGAEVQE